MKEFKEGDTIKIIGDSNNHCIPIGSELVLDCKSGVNSFFIKNELGNFRIVLNWDFIHIESILTDEADINAEIQAVLDPNRHQSLTEFNRVSSYGGGGYLNAQFSKPSQQIDLNTKDLD